MQDKTNSCYTAAKLFSAEETAQVAQMKRFCEWMQADARLRESLNTDEGLTAEQEAWLRKIGVKLNLEDIEFFHKHPLETGVYIAYVMTDRENEMPDEVKEIAEKYPLMRLWGRFNKSRSNLNALLAYRSSLVSANEKFDAWYKRRIASARSELGYFGHQISHPVFAFELNAGCSVGCWFCSFATDRLSATLNYPENRDEVMSIVRHCGEIFGKEISGMALPYYRTEPHDNPHYINFIKDYERETGAVLCTSTAVCTDFEWINNLLEYYQKREDGQVYFWPRLSVLTLDVLKKLHMAYSAEELGQIELLIQAKNNTRPKVTGGRILKENAGLREIENLSEQEDRLALLSAVPQGSIACVSGFLINLITRVITVVSPCYTCNEWPHGYREFGEARYNNADDFPEVIKGLVESCMFLSPPKDKPLRFRGDIIFRPTEEGFDLATAHQLHHFKGKAKCGPLGDLIAEGVHTYAQIADVLQKEHNVNPIIIHSVVQQLFDDGFIDEVVNEVKTKML